MQNIYRAKVVNKNKWRELSAKNEWVTGYLVSNKNTKKYYIEWYGPVPDYSNYFNNKEITFTQSFHI